MSLQTRQHMLKKNTCLMHGKSELKRVLKKRTANIHDYGYVNIFFAS
jgi:hypothetical protein